jgi:hypothetical protein
MARAGMKPARIGKAMLLQFRLPPSELPALQQVQNVVCYYRRTKLGGSDTTSSIVAAVRSQAFTGSEEEHQPFSFGWDMDADGNLSSETLTRNRSSWATQPKPCCAKLLASQGRSSSL